MGKQYFAEWGGPVGNEMVADGYHPPLEAILAPDSPSLSAQAPSSPRPPMEHPAPESSLDKNCAQSQAPAVDRTQNGQLTWGQPHEQYRKGGYRRKESNEVSKTRLAPRGAAEAKSIPVGGTAMATSETACGTRAGDREGADGLGYPRPVFREDRPCGLSPLGLCCGRGSSEGYAQWRKRRSRTQWQHPGSPFVGDGGGPVLSA